MGCMRNGFITIFGQKQLFVLMASPFLVFLGDKNLFSLGLQVAHSVSGILSLKTRPHHQRPNSHASMMEKLRRSSVELRISTILKEETYDFIDQDGVIRRSTHTRCELLSAETTGNLEYAAIGSDIDKPQSSAEIELSTVQSIPFATRSISESEVGKPIPREERMRRRTEFRLQLCQKKHDILVKQNTREQDRLQLWHEISELDPTVETTSQNTARAPSPRSQTYVDEDGNVRRKSSFCFEQQSDASATIDQGPTSVGDLVHEDQHNAVLKYPPSPVSLVLGPGNLSPTTPRIRASFVFEFAQAIIDS
ncbi:unnamed protein product [Phytophthora fragariaefolia]|uniref:Unnamed protein product n=1 Tax=Phytophthora fragariaefolia TaxID=1490495 RepID=A0A9W7CVQ2_9STRA|nr:unnamed protein product [Phytophthora fragariaefolia]